jgi:C1A family cysteine protease
MKNRRLGHLLLSLCVLGPAAVVACHSKPENGRGSTPTPSSSAGPIATNDNDNDEDDDGGSDDGSPGGGGHKKHRHATADDGGPIAPTAKLVINQPGPTPLEPPALRKPPSLPALPDLPSRSKYPKMSTPAKGSDTDECGQVWSGSEWVSVECIDPDRHGHEARAAKVVVPYDKMKAPTEHLPKMVDHRADGTEGPVRKQGGPQCTAFAFTAALDHAYARWTGTPGAFSVMQVWARYHLLQEHAAAENNIGDFLSNESDWPYNAAEANSWMHCKTHKDEHKEKDKDDHKDKDKDEHKEKDKDEHACGKPADEEKLKSLNAHPVAEITQIEVVPTSELEVLREKLAAGQDVTVAVKLPSFATAGEPGSKYIVGTTSAAKPKGGHQILLAGYAMTPNGNYYLVHNSWGTHWGDEGFAWLHEDILKSYWLDKVMVIPDVEPLEVMHLRQRAHGALTAKCGEDKIPDSISGLCAGKCPDGSPRHNDVCGKAAECPAGFINLTGECVLAAPKTAGADPATKVRWSCASGGCSYLVPKEKFGCKDEECGVSCPAPDFRLAETQKGLVCVE